MKYYKQYMDRQQVSPQLHQRLLALEAVPPQKCPLGGKKGRERWAVGLAALAACCVLAVGVGRGWAPPTQQAGQFAYDALYPGQKDTYGPGEVVPEWLDPGQSGQDNQKELDQASGQSQYQELASLAQARALEVFAPYLPTQGVPGYGEFYGALGLGPDGNQTLSVRWSRGYDDVQLLVSLPRAGAEVETVDVANPDSYDTRLYEIPWADTVPQAYQEHFFMPVFQASDLSLAVVEARGSEKDTGGMAYRFGVLHPDGTLVEYRCDGLTEQQVWELVQETLES